jgi:GT2 family glycosyltransferase
VTQPDLSIVTASFNTREMLHAALEAVERTRGRLRIEHWVVDNASADGTVEMIRRQHPGVRLIVSQENLGPGRARNRAIPSCTGRYVLNLDSDVVVHPGTMEILVEYMDQHPEVGAAGCTLLNPDGTPQPSIRGLRQIGPAIRRKLRARLTGRRDDLTSPTSPVLVGWLVGAVCIYRKTALDQIGLFDPQFFIYHEDLDLHTRLHLKGWKVAFVPSAAVTHRLGGTTDRNFAAARFDCEYGELLFARKYGPPWWYWYSRVSLLLRAFYFARICSDEKLRQRFWRKSPAVARRVYRELLRVSLPIPGRRLAASSAPPAGAEWMREARAARAEQAT